MQTTALRAPRINHRAPIQLHRGRYTFSGTVWNLSENGLFVQFTQPFYPGQMVDLEFDPKSPHSFVAKGMVRWRRTDKRSSIGLGAVGMGIQIIEPSPAFARFLKTIHKPAEVDVADLEIFYQTDKQFIDDYRENIRSGALFVETNDVYTQNQQLSLRLILPDRRTHILCQATVAQIFDAQHSPHLGKPGIVVVLNDFNAQKQGVLANYVSTVLQTKMLFKQNERGYIRREYRELPDESSFDKMSIIELLHLLGHERGSLSVAIQSDSGKFLSHVSQGHISCREIRLARLLPTLSKSERGSFTITRHDTPINLSRSESLVELIFAVLREAYSIERIWEYVEIHETHYVTATEHSQPRYIESELPALSQRILQEARTGAQICTLEGLCKGDYDELIRQIFALLVLDLVELVPSECAESIVRRIPRLSPELEKIGLKPARGKATPRKGSPHARHKFQLAKQQLQARDYVLAQKAFQNAVDAEPENSFYRCYNGYAIFMACKMTGLQAALAELNKALELDPNNEFAELFLARIYQKIGKRGEAQRHLTNLLTRNPKNVAARKLLDSL